MNDSKIGELIELKQLKYAALIAFLLVGLTAFSQKVVGFQMSDCARDSYAAFMHTHRLIQKESGKSKVKWYVTYNENHDITDVGALSGINDQCVSDMQVISGKEYLKLMATDP